MNEMFDGLFSISRTKKYFYFSRIKLHYRLFSLEKAAPLTGFMKRSFDRDALFNFICCDYK
jgi:hypothetical protein